jgi:hypothetical protein
VLEAACSVTCQHLLFKLVPRKVNAANVRKGLAAHNKHGDEAINFIIADDSIRRIFEECFLLLSSKVQIRPFDILNSPTITAK